MKNVILGVSLLLSACSSSPVLLSNVYFDHANEMVTPKQTQSLVAFHSGSQVTVSLLSFDGNTLVPATSESITAIEFMSGEHRVEISVSATSANFSGQLTYRKQLSHHFEAGKKYKIVVNNYQEKSLGLEQVIANNSYVAVKAF